MTTRTHTTARTYTHTATHLGGVIASGLAETLLSIGITPAKVAPVHSFESAFAAWIEARELGQVLVTLTPPGGVETAGYSFDIRYTAFDPAQEFRDQLARLRRQLAKEPRVRNGTDFEVVARPRQGWSLSAQPGWGGLGRNLPSFEGGFRHGTAGSGPGASAILRSHRNG